jgi:hypothetical protein
LSDQPAKKKHCPNPLGLNGKPSDEKKIPLTIKLIQAHYERLGLNKGWKRERLVRLANMMNCTPREVWAMVGMSGKSYRSYFKAPIPIPASILLTMIEQTYMEVKYGLKYDPIVPLDILSKAQVKEG